MKKSKKEAFFIALILIVGMILLFFAPGPQAKFIGLVLAVIGFFLLYVISKPEGTSDWEKSLEALKNAFKSPV